MTKISEVPTETSDHHTGLDYVRTFSKRMLKTQLFMGTYEEKRFVQPLNSYRDVVRVDSSEKLFIKDLLTVKHKVQRELADTLPWIGITEPNVIGAPAGYSLWVILPIEIFGTYWFKVKSVQFLPEEVRVKLEVVRAVNATADKSQLAPQIKGGDQSSTDLKNVSQQVSENLSQFFRENLTLSNIKHTVVFLSLLVSTIIVGAINLVKYLLEYKLKFIREFSGLVKAFTPILITCLELITRTVYGTFGFILALFFGSQARRVVPQDNFSQYRPRPMIEYPEDYYGTGSNQRRRKPYRSSVTIQSLDD